MGLMHVVLYPSEFSYFHFVFDLRREISLWKAFNLYLALLLIEPCYEKTGFWHMRKQRLRSASG